VPKHQFDVASKDYHKEFVADGEKHVAKYGDKWVRVTGLVTSISVASGKLTLRLEGGTDAPPVGEAEVSCYFETGDDWGKALAGHTVTLVGKADDEPLFGPFLKECRLVKVAGPGPLFFTAEQLGKLGSSGIGALVAYEGQNLVVEGTIAALERRGGALSVEISTGTSIPIRLIQSRGPIPATLKVGQRVTFYGDMVAGLQEISFGGGLIDATGAAITKP